jgi:NTE family protein
MTGRRVALVLGGGAARGMAHLGVLRVLLREQIPIDMVVGASMGGLIGAVFALGIPQEESEALARSIGWQDLTDLTIPALGFNAGLRLERVIRQAVHGRGFADLQIPLAVVATDIERGEEVVFQSGDLVNALRASCSIPGIFAPVRWDGRLLVDGGLKNTVPVSVARRLGATIVLAVDVGFCVRRGPITNIMQIFYQATQITGQELNNYQVMTADLVIRPDLGDIEQMAFHRSAEAMQRGGEATERLREEIHRCVGRDATEAR